MHLPSWARVPVQSPAEKTLVAKLAAAVTSVQSSEIESGGGLIETGLKGESDIRVAELVGLT